MLPACKVAQPAHELMTPQAADDVILEQIRRKLSLVVRNAKISFKLVAHAAQIARQIKPAKLSKKAHNKRDTEVLRTLAPSCVHDICVSPHLTQRNLVALTVAEQPNLITG